MGKISVSFSFIVFQVFSPGSMDVVSSSLTAISLLWAPLESCCFYSRKLKKRVKTLRYELEGLTTKENDIKAEISSGMVNQRKKLRSEIQSWLKNVDKLGAEVKQMETEIEKCMKGCLPNYISRYRLGKMMVNRIKEMSELHARGVFPNGLFIDSFQDSGRILPTTGLVGDKTVNRVSKAIWKLLTDTNVSMIGVHGMGGVGKTSIMMHIYNQLIECKIFDQVIWVNVSKTFNVEKLQLDIADATNLELSKDENVIWRSTRLLEHLQGKKFVLILDDMWQKFSLSWHGNCQKLSTLFLQGNPLPEKIPDSFFMQMQRLKVLDLSKTGIKSLPESVSTLRCLRALLLSFSKLKEIPSLTMLKELRVLDLSHSLLRKLPNDIDELKNLRRLDLSYTEKLRIFPYNVVQNLSCLENFSMFRSKCRWSSTTGVGFDDISSLTSLGLSFEDRTSFIEYVRSKHWQELQSYHLGIGQLSFFQPISKGTRSIEIQGYDLVWQDRVIELPNNIQHLALHGCNDITFLSKLSDATNLENLRQCYLSNCNGIEFITASGNCFPSLELLVLRKLPKLKAISNGIAASQIFANLKSLKAHSCNSMKYLFSSGMLQDLQNLEEIEVWNSSLIHEIVEDKTGSNVSLISTVLLPKLRRLSLSTLPELNYITKKVLVCDSLETIEIWDCEKLRALPFSISYLPSSLKHIKGCRNWWDGLEWDETSCKSLLQPFFYQGT
ncbi:hypothetical protein QVD17_06323 [Tagetes erecta]|uniref:Disease resistance protein n=1 Tax=Tagetes erecta TaxID=13708 RepID=A0AAD8LDJ1_TARER|nr:hypothetical protein QVD17_06323 [Tagetes erecta]